MRIVNWIPLLAPLSLLLACEETHQLDDFGETMEVEVEDKTVCDGAQSWEDVEDGDADLQEWARSEGVMRFKMGIPGTKDGDTFCSGALISPNLFLSAGHCFDEPLLSGKGYDLPPDISTAEDFCQYVEVDFEYQNVGGVTTTAPVYFACEEVLAKAFWDTNYEDYLLIRLEGKPGEVYGYLEPDLRGTIPGEGIRTIGHPSGDPKSFSEGVADSLNPSDISPTYDDDLLAVFQNESIGGFSGSPVVDDDGHVLGPMHASIRDCDVVGDNTARHMTTRLEALHEVIPELSEWDFFDQRENGSVEAGDAFGAAVTTGDFDGDGIADVVASAPYDDNGSSKPYAGRLSVRYGSTRGPDVGRSVETWQEAGSGPESGDFYGWAMAAGDFDGDGFDDLAVSAPFEDWGSAGYSGVVEIFFGSASGLIFDTTPTYFLPSHFGATNSDAFFGYALVTGDIDDDGYDDLIIGSPGEDDSAGAIYELHGYYNGLSSSSTHAKRMTSTTHTRTAGDWFGAALAAGDFDGNGGADIAVGVPYGDPTYRGSTVRDAGLVVALFSNGYELSGSGQLLIQSGGSSPEPDDYFGLALAAGDLDYDGYDDLVVGSPYEDYSSRSDVGMIHLIEGTYVGLSSGSVDWYWEDSFTGGEVEAYNRFGFSLAVADFDGDTDLDLAVGIPDGALDIDGAVVNAGRVVIREGDMGGLTSNIVEVEHDAIVGAQDGDQFGYALAAGDVDGDGDSDLVVGLPGQSTSGATGAGGVFIADIE